MAKQLGRPKIKPGPMNTSGGNTGQYAVALQMDVKQKFKELCEQNNVTPATGLRLMVLNALQAGQLPANKETDNA